jgi:glycosyltransferase domain-containing protein
MDQDVNRRNGSSPIMSTLSKLSIVIPSYERPRYALRNMRYWSSREVEVHVLDGSAVPIEEPLLTEFAPNVHYHHLPIPLLHRLGGAGQYLRTEYTLFVGDDEFFFPAGLEACIAELEADAELVSCMGRCLAFEPTSSGVAAWPFYPDMKDYSVSQDDPVQRMIAHMAFYTCSTIYSVVRTPAWKRAMSILPKHQFSVDAMGELEFELAISYFGKSKVIPVAMWLRSVENPSIRDEYDVLRFPEWWKDPKYELERAKLLTIMTDVLAEDDPTKAEAIRDGLRRASDAYVAFVESRPPKKLRSAVVRRIPRPMVEVMKGALATLRLRQPAARRASLVDAGKDFERDGVRVDFAQLAEIEALVTEFHRA